MLAVQVVNILIPFFSKVSEGLANRIGEGIFDESKHLYEAIHARFSREPDGGKASMLLQNFATDPEEYSSNLEKKLAAVLQTDPDFARALQQILQSGPIQTMQFGDESFIKNTQMNNALGRGTQQMTGGDKTIFEGVSMDIGPRKEQDC
jgi:hypothetical protein